MTHHLRPRTAVLRLELDPDARPAGSELALTTRTGEPVWSGPAGGDSWRTGLRLRARWQGSWADALWAMTVAVLDAELATHGLRRERDRATDVRTDVRTDADGDATALTVRCSVVPCAARLSDLDELDLGRRASVRS